MHRSGPNGEQHLLADPAACYRSVLEVFVQASTETVRLIDDPAEAEVVLCPVRLNIYGHYLERLRASDLYRQHGQKVAVYSFDDNQYPSVRGLYTSLPRSWRHRTWAQSAHYLSEHLPAFHFTSAEAAAPRDVLFSFAGTAGNHPLRRRIFALQHRDALFFDPTNLAPGIDWRLSGESGNAEQRYREIMLRSECVLCPRGVAPSSIRIYEALEAGCVPVILSDDVSLPAGPDWSEFSLTIPEAELDAIPELLEACRERLPQMRQAARRVWSEYFSPQASAASMLRWLKMLTIPEPTRLREYYFLRLHEYTRLARWRAAARHLIKGD